jgi:hypothetical protein
MEEGESIIFQAPEAIDRGNIEGNIQNKVYITDQMEGLKTANDVGKKAKSFYREKYKEALSKEDAAFDSSKAEYQIASSQVGWDLKKIQKKIDKGEALDSVKDIIPMAENTALNYVQSASSLKSLSPLKIMDMMNLNSLKDLEGYDEVESLFEEKVEGNDLDFGSIVSSLMRIAGSFEDAMGNPKVFEILKTPENRFASSAFSKILEISGLENESIEKNSSYFEDNLEKLINKIQGKEVGSPETEKPKEEVKIEDIPLLPEEEKEKESQAVEETTALEQIQEPKEEEKPAGEESVVTETQTVESSQEGEGFTPPETEEPKTLQETPPLESVTEEPKKLQETPPLESVTEEPKTLQETTPLESVTEGKLSGTEEKSSESSSGYSSLLSSLFPGVFGGGEKMTESVEGLAESIPGGESSFGGGFTQFSDKISLEEKKSAASETLGGMTPIKETKIQNLASVESKPETKPDKQESSKEESKAPTTSSSEPNAAGGSSSVPGETKKPQETKESQATSESEGSSDLSNKMDVMISLLSEVSESLQGPLVVKSSSRNFD